MKSQVDMNQLNEKGQYKQKGKVRIGYTKEGELSKKGSQKNKRLTCIHCGMLSHISNKCWSNGKKNSMESVTIAISMVIEIANARINLILKVKEKFSWSQRK